MSRILLIDDDPLFLGLLSGYVRERFPTLELVCERDPLRGLAAISADLDLLLLDLEMPGLDGGKMLAYALEKGLSKNRIVILSGRDAEYLHRRFPMGHCLAVLNKHEARQRTALEMIFASLERKRAAANSCCAGQS